MTIPSNTPDIGIKQGDTPLLPFDPVELTHVRCRPVDLARMLNVSRQAVSQWVKQGKVTLGADGMLDPKIAVKQLLANSDPGRLRAKVLAPLTRDVGSLSQRIASLEKANALLVKEKNELAEQLYELGEAFEFFQSWVKRDILMLADADDPVSEIDALIDKAIAAAVNLFDDPDLEDIESLDSEGLMIRAPGE